MKAMGYPFLVPFPERCKKRGMELRRYKKQGIAALFPRTLQEAGDGTYEGIRNGESHLQKAIGGCA